MNISHILLGAAMLIAAPMANEGSHATAQDKKDSQLVIVENPAVHDPVMAYEGGQVLSLLYRPWNHADDFY